MLWSSAILTSAHHHAEFVLDTLRHVKPVKSACSSYIRPWLNFLVPLITAPFVTSLINASLSSGRFPTAFKRAVITPLLKQPGMDMNAPQSYRPISNLSVLSKLTERVVSTQLQT